MADKPRSTLNHHEFFMSICLGLAEMAKVRGDYPVGSVIVKDGQVIGKGIEGGKTKKDITCHAETEAIRDAVKHLETQDLSLCTLYTTHEPCILCSYVIRHSRIHTVVIGISGGDTGGISSNYPLLEDQTIEKWGKPPVLVKGILEKECENITKYYNPPPA